MSQPAYLGDGVYIQHDQFGNVVITANCHLPTDECPGGDPEYSISIDPEATAGLLHWLVRNEKVAQTIWEFAVKEALISGGFVK